MGLTEGERRPQRGAVWVLPSRHGRVDLCFSFLVSNAAQRWDFSLAETIRLCPARQCVVCPLCLSLQSHCYLSYVKGEIGFCSDLVGCLLCVSHSLDISTHPAWDCTSGPELGVEGVGYWVEKGLLVLISVTAKPRHEIARASNERVGHRSRCGAWNCRGMWRALEESFAW